jgi:pimeloyl-ACP methyl ester carboxylesterase
MPTFSSYDGTRLSYAEVGSGPRLVCLPGGPGRAAAYLEDLGGLAADRTLVLLDGRATGRSEVPADPATLRFDRLADDVEALREHLGEERLDLLGHSAGTMVAQAWASAHPERVGSLVLVTPTGALQGSNRTDVLDIVATRSDEPWYADAREALDAFETAPPSQQQTLFRAIRPFMYGRWDDRTQAHAATADSQSSKRAELGFRPVNETDVDVPALVSGLSAVTAPVLVLGGERDAMTGVAAVHAVAASFPKATAVVLPGAGHFPWVDEPEAFAATVRGFLG